MAAVAVLIVEVTSGRLLLIESEFSVAPASFNVTADRTDRQNGQRQNPKSEFAVEDKATRNQNLPPITRSWANVQ
jgi:hypothetical protein